MKGRDFLDALAFCALTAAVAGAGWLLVPRLGIPIILLGAVAVAHGALAIAYRIARRPAPLPPREGAAGVATRNPV